MLGRGFETQKTIDESKSIRRKQVAQHMESQDKDSIELSQVERQLLLYELFLFNEESVTRELIKHCIPISDRMLQRDLKHLTEAGLICVRYSKKEAAYIQYPDEVRFNPSSMAGRQLLHLKRLSRIGMLMRQLGNDPLKQNEIFDYKQLKSIKQNYEELFPDIPDRTRQRDFTVLRNIGYPIEYIREYRYYNAWDYTEFREDFGLFWKDGVLKRKLGETDHESQYISAESIAENDSFLKEIDIIF